MKSTPNLSPVHSSPKLRIEQMSPDCLAQGLVLSKLAGWNQLRPDWELLYGLNPKGAFVALADNQVVGTVTTADYDTAIGWIAMVLVNPSHRGMGIATQLMQRALQALAHVDSIQLDATPAGRNVYHKIGFQDLFGLKRLTAGTGFSLNVSDQPSQQIRRMRNEDLAQVILLDQRAAGVNRSVLLQGLFTMAPEYAWVHQADGTVSGFIFGRHGIKYESVGPLLANDTTAALALFSRFLRETAARPIAMDCPDFATEWQPKLLDAGMTVERPFTRMALRQPLAFPLHQQSIYAIAGPEIG